MGFEGKSHGISSHYLKKSVLNGGKNKNRKNNKDSADSADSFEILNSQA